MTKKPKADTLLRIAAALGVPLREIMRHSKKPGGDLLDDLAELFDQLDSKNKQVLIATARVLKDSQK